MRHPDLLRLRPHAHGPFADFRRGIGDGGSGGSGEVRGETDEADVVGVWDGLDEEVVDGWGWDVNGWDGTAETSGA